jgi:hypothetical protein
MTFDRIVNMVANAVVRRVVNLVVDRGFRLFTRRGPAAAPGPEAGDSPTGPRAANAPGDAQGLARRARIAARTLRRLGR